MGQVGAVVNHGFPWAVRQFCYLLPDQFTMAELRRVYEMILGVKLNKSSFRAKVRERDFLEPVPGSMQIGGHRPAQLYTLKRYDSSDEGTAHCCKVSVPLLY